MLYPFFCDSFNVFVAFLSPFLNKFFINENSFVELLFINVDKFLKRRINNKKRFEM
ncbi:hypothetical protein LEP1GSC024_0360 [Leptospira noguchii str. 2001034031]|uniref:Uncharacterized protein n=1 Tax=Leptospira noguchii str. 2001034031 TaxID=1193053 RepID=M6YWG0_9LEPT|nr:hypothetical protein LEP1GSC024_0360 [Leptospira noguchii str. 2001034031]